MNEPLIPEVQLDELDYPLAISGYDPTKPAPSLSKWQRLRSYARTARGRIYLLFWFLFAGVCAWYLVVQSLALDATYHTPVIHTEFDLHKTLSLPILIVCNPCAGQNITLVKMSVNAQFVDPRPYIIDQVNHLGTMQTTCMVFDLSSIPLSDGVQDGPGINFMFDLHKNDPETCGLYGAGFFLVDQAEYNSGGFGTRNFMFVSTGFATNIRVSKSILEQIDGYDKVTYSSSTTATLLKIDNPYSTVIMGLSFESFVVQKYIEQYDTDFLRFLANVGGFITLAFTVRKFISWLIYKLFTWRCGSATAQS